MSHGALPVGLQCEWGRGNGILSVMHREAAVSPCESQNPVGEIMLIANICVVLSDRQVINIQYICNICVRVFSCSL